jgi:eukaryotic-like serine/threonine-protein kinase
VADRDGERVGGMVRPRYLVETQERLHHPLHLVLVGVAVPADGLLDPVRRVLGRPDARPCAGDENRPSGLADGKRRPGVGADERLLERDDVGLASRDQRGHELEQPAQPLLDTAAGPGRPAAGLEPGQPVAAHVDDAVTAGSRTRVDADDLHGGKVRPASDDGAGRLRSVQELIGGRYRLRERLGAGGMAEVWVADDEELERLVAVKLLMPAADAARFRRESRAAAALSDPNVAAIYDYGEAGDRPYIIQEYLRGGTLEERLRPGRPLAADEAATISRDVALGLAHAHSRGIVHRDLKPANVLFDAEGRAKIADFGIAHLPGAPTLTEAGTLLGTAAYLSPEQAAGKPATVASDVYAFGVILYRMLAGRVPFEAESALEVARLHVEADPPPLVARDPQAAGLVAVATAALAKDPKDRPADGAALLAALDLGVLPSGAKTVVMRRPPRPARRRARRTMLPLLTLLVLGAGGAALAAVAFRSDDGGPQAPTTRPPGTSSRSTTPTIEPAPPTTPPPPPPPPSPTTTTTTTTTTPKTSTRRPPPPPTTTTTAKPPPPPPPPPTTTAPPPPPPPPPPTEPPSPAPPPPPPPPPAPTTTGPPPPPPSGSPRNAQAP